MSPELRGEVLLTILGMALVTYATRASGLWLLARVRPSPRLAAGLRHLPGTMLVALLAPTVLARSRAETLAAVVTVLTAARTGNVPLAMLAGVGVVWALRTLT